MQKCIADPCHVFPKDGNYVISDGRALLKAMHASVIIPNPTDPFLLCNSNSLLREAFFRSKAKLNLTKNQIFAVTSNQIDLSLPASEIMLQNCNAPCLEILCGQPFLLGANLPFIIFFRSLIPRVRRNFL